MSAIQASFTRKLPVLLKNTGKIAYNYGHQLTQNTASLKSNALIVSSLILVLSRIAVSHTSAQRAKNTPDGPFREREAIKTSIRELAGWSLSFLVLRSIEKTVKAGLRWAFSIAFDPAAESGMVKAFRDFRGQMGALFKRGTPLPDVLPPKINYGETALKFAENGTLFKRLEGFIGLFSRNKNLSAVAKMQNFYRWFPVLVGSIPAVLLSGWALERFSLDHSDQVVQRINNWLHPDRTSVAKPSLPSGTEVPPQPAAFPGLPRSGVTPAPSQNAVRFQSFMEDVRRKQMERGML